MYALPHNTLERQIFYEDPLTFYVNVCVTEQQINFKIAHQLRPCSTENLQEIQKQVWQSNILVDDWNKLMGAKHPFYHKIALKYHNLTMIRHP